MIINVNIRLIFSITIKFEQINHGVLIFRLNDVSS